MARLEAVPFDWSFVWQLAPAIVLRMIQVLLALPKPSGRNSA